MADALKEALEHHKTALHCAVDGFDNDAIHCLVCCCSALIALASQQAEELSRLRAAVEALKAQRGEGNG
jgi:hypothetical protein